MTLYQDENLQVEAVPNGRNAEYGYLTVVNSRSVGSGFGGFGYWFTVGTYKSIKIAARRAQKQLADLGRMIEIEAQI